MCPNDETIHIYRRDSQTSEAWRLETVLREHDQLITAMDWHSDARGEHLLTVSSDRNGYVWDRLPGAASTWKPTLVLLRLRRAANCVQWSPNGEKFAVGGAEGIISVGYYERDNDWWVCKHLKSSLDSSPILAVTWHPSERLLAASSLAGKVQVLGTWLKQVDGAEGAAAARNADRGQASPPAWISSMGGDGGSLWEGNFDKQLGSLEYGCWVHSLSFSPSGNVLAMAAHDGNVYIMDFACGEQVAVPSASKDVLPLRRVLFVSEQGLICTGFGGDPPLLLVRAGGSGWRLEGPLRCAATSSIGRGGSSPAASSSQARLPEALKASTSRAFGGALAKFRALDSQGVMHDAAGDIHDAPDAKGAGTIFGTASGSAGSPHRNTISEIRLIPGGGLASSGYDGNLVTWEVAPVLASIGVANL